VGVVRVIVKARLTEFADAHAAARASLSTWYSIVRRASWRSFNDVRLTFASADRVRLEHGNVITIFNVGGNDYRVLTHIKFNTRCVYVKRVLTHAEYDDETWKETLDHAEED
jgi:mRNA interferase HigB